MCVMGGEVVRKSGNELFLSIYDQIGPNFILIKSLSSHH